VHADADFVRGEREGLADAIVVCAATLAWVVGRRSILERINRLAAGLQWPSTLAGTEPGFAASRYVIDQRRRDEGYVAA